MKKNKEGMRYILAGIQIGLIIFDSFIGLKYLLRGEWAKSLLFFCVALWLLVSMISTRLINKSEKEILEIRKISDEQFKIIEDNLRAIDELQSKTFIQKEIVM